MLSTTALTACSELTVEDRRKVWGCGMQDQTEKDASDASDGKQTEKDKGRYPERNAWTGGWAGGTSCLAAASDLESWHRKFVMVSIQMRASHGCAAHAGGEKGVQAFVKEVRAAWYNLSKHEWCRVHSAIEH